MKKLLALALIASASQLAAAATAEEDVAHYVTAVNGPLSVRIKAIDELAWKGISDPRVFDPIEQRVLAESANGFAGIDPNDIEHDIRALSFSGQAKYMGTLSKVAADSRYARTVRTGMTDLPHYQAWNPVISNRATWDPNLSDDDNRLINMLHSNDFVLKRLAGKRMYFENKDPAVLEAAAAAIKASFHDKHSGDDADGLAWMIKGLGSAKQMQYRPLFVQIAAEAPDHEAVSHAQRVLDKYLPNP